MKNVILCIIVWAVIPILVHSQSRIIISKSSDNLTELSITYDEDGKRSVKVTAEDENGDPVVLEWEDDGTIPSNIRDKLEELDIDIDESEDRRYSFDFGFPGQGKAVLGVRLINTDDGVVIDEMDEDGAAFEAGLREGDRLVAIDGKLVTDTRDVVDFIRDRDPGDQVVIEYLRNGRSNEVNVTLKESEYPFLGRDFHMDEFRFPDFDFDFDRHGFKDDFHFEFDHRGLEESLERLREDLEGMHFDFRGLDDFEWRGWHGPQLGMVIEEDDEGVRIGSVREDGPADDAGLREGDILLEIDDRAVSDLEDVTDIIRNKEAGEEVEIRYRRDDEEHTTTATLSEFMNPNRIRIRTVPRIRRIHHGHHWVPRYWHRIRRS